MSIGHDSGSVTGPGGAAGDATLLAEAEARVRQGDAGGARRLLEAAARAGHSSAAVQLGVMEIIGLGGPVDVAAAAARLREAADRGHGPASALHAQLIAAGAAGLDRDFDEVVSRLIAAARVGDPRAAIQVAVLIPDTPGNAAVRSSLLQAAAASGEPIARVLLDWSPPSAPAAPLDWQDVRRRIVLPHERPLPEAEARSERPRITSRPGLLTAVECLYVALRGMPMLRQASVNAPDGRPVVDPMRSNEAMKFGLLEADVVVHSIDLRVAAALGHPAEHGEGLALLRYQVGQQYLPHCDWIDARSEGNRADLERWGQRVATCVVYLNDAFEGGATAFPRLGLEFRGGVGDAFLWDNVLPNGDVDPLTLHAGRPPTQGVKYLLSKWMRDRSQVGNEG